MKKTLILSLLVSSLLLSGCFEKQSQQQDTSKNSGEKINQNASGNDSKSSENSNSESNLKGVSLKELMENKEDVKCEISTGNEQGQQKITMYVDGQSGKIRMDANMEVSMGTGGKQKINMSNIIDSQYYYSWGDMMSGQGFKFSMSEKDAQLDMDKKVDLDCIKWEKDSSKFELPKDIEFKDVQQDSASEK